MMTKRKKHNLFIGVYVALLLLVSVIAADCSGTAGKKGKVYPKVDLPQPIYSMTPDTLPFRFGISDQAVFSARKNKEGEYFCDIIYPLLNAQLYCTWHRISPERFPLMAEESHKLAYQHTAIATGINEKLYENDLVHVYGILYDIKGDVATPLQVALTDSSSYFFNASLYFNATPNADSIAPTLDYIRKDVIHLMESYVSVKH